MSLRGKKVLITCGPTWVPIDDVRVLSNQSTGELGLIVSKLLIAAGAKLTVLQGPVTSRWSKIKATIIPFRFFHELANLLTAETKKNYDVVIHAAAVSDYQLRKPFVGKIKSSKSKGRAEGLRLDLVKTPKLINQIKRNSPRTFLVGFKLETEDGVNNLGGEVKKLLTQSKCDLVVANFYSGSKYNALLIDKDRDLIAKVQGKKALGRAMVDLLRNRL